MDIKHFISSNVIEFVNTFDYYHMLKLQMSISRMHYRDCSENRLRPSYCTAYHLAS